MKNKKIKTVYTCGSLLTLSLLLACSSQAPQPEDALVRVNGRYISQAQVEKSGQPVEAWVEGELWFEKAKKENFVQTSELARRVVADAYVKELRSQISVSEDELKRVFEAKKADLEKVRAKHILIAAKTGAERGKAKEKAERIKKEMNTQRGQSFDSFVQKYSEDQGTKKRNGDLGFFARNDMPESFSEAVFSMEKVGDVSKPIESPRGFHIVQLVGAKRGLDFFNKSIENQIRNEKLEAKKSALLAEMKKSAQIDYLKKSELKKD